MGDWELGIGNLKLGIGNWELEEERIFFVVPLYHCFLLYIGSPEF